jgi:hypothetical protein
MSRWRFAMSSAVIAPGAARADRFGFALSPALGSSGRAARRRRVTGFFDVFFFFFFFAGFAGDLLAVPFVFFFFFLAGIDSISPSAENAAIVSDRSRCGPWVSMPSLRPAQPCKGRRLLVYTSGMDDPGSPPPRGYRLAEAHSSSPSPTVPQGHGIEDRPDTVTPSGPTRGRGFDLAASVLLVALTLALAYPAARGPFAGDDFRNLRQSTGGAAAVLRFFEEWVRGDSWPAPRIFLLAERAVFGLEATGYHAVHLLLHALATLLVYAVARNLLRDRPAATAAGVLFALFPIHGAAVFWISGLPEVLAAAAGLAAVWLHLRVLRGPGGWIAAAGSVVAGAVALLSSSGGLAVPALLLVLLFLPSRDRRARRLAAGAGLVLVQGGLAAGGLYLRTMARGGGAESVPLSLPESIGSACFRAAEGLGAILYPFDLYQVEAWYQARPLLFQLAGAAVVVLVVPSLVVATRGTRGRWTPFVFGALWFAAAILPCLGLLQRRLLYLPSVGAALMASSLVFVPRRAGRLLGGGVLLALAALYGLGWNGRARDWEEAGALSRAYLASLDAELPEGAEGEILFVQLPWGYRSALLFTHDSIGEAIRMREGRPRTIRVLSRVVLEGGAEYASEAEWAGEGVLRCRIRPGRYRTFVIGSPEGNARKTGRLPPGTKVEGNGFTTIVRGVDETGRVTEIEVELDAPLPPEARVLEADLDGFRPMLP